MTARRAAVDAAAAAHAAELLKPQGTPSRTAYVLLARAEECEQSGQKTGLDLPTPCHGSVTEWAEKTLTVAQRMYAVQLRLATHGPSEHDAAGCDHCHKARATVLVLMRRGAQGYRCTKCIRAQYESIYSAGGVAVGICDTSGGPEWDTREERDADRAALTALESRGVL